MKSRSKFFWIYSIALFSVAFILIGFSAFTGVRYQQTKSEAKQLYQGAQTSVLELQDDLEKLKLDNTTLKEQVKVLQTESEQLKMTVKKTEALQALSKVQVLLNAKNKAEARIALNAVDSSLLTDDALTLYQELNETLN